MTFILTSGTSEGIWRQRIDMCFDARFHPRVRTSRAEKILCHTVVQSRSPSLSFGTDPATRKEYVLQLPLKKYGLWGSNALNIMSVTIRPTHSFNLLCSVLPQSYSNSEWLSLTCSRYAHNLAYFCFVGSIHHIQLRTRPYSVQQLPQASMIAISSVYTNLSDLRFNFNLH